MTVYDEMTKALAEPPRKPLEDTACIHPSALDVIKRQTVSASMIDPFALQVTTCTALDRDECFLMTRKMWEMISAFPTPDLQAEAMRKIAKSMEAQRLGG